MGNRRLSLLIVVFWACFSVLVADSRADDHQRVEGWMIIPSIQGFYKSISSTRIVNRAYDLSQLEFGVTHLDGTSWVDDGWGRIVIAGHNPGGFGNLWQVNPGDTIIIVSHYGISKWEVAETLAVGNEIDYLNPTKTFTLTLITCLTRGETWLVINAYPVVQ